MVHTKEIKVKEEDLDVLGHVNNSVYISYLEQARTSWYRNVGLSQDEMDRRMIGTVVLKLEIFFVKEARLGELLTIKTIPVRLGNKSFVFEQVIFNEAGEIVTEATVTNVMFDVKTRKGMLVVDEISRNFLHSTSNGESYASI